MRGQDPALIHDALYDAEEFFAAELGGADENESSDQFQKLVSRYGSPHEVALAYVQNHPEVPESVPDTAIENEKSKNSFLNSFKIFADGRVYGQLLYLLLMLPLSIFYFTFVVTGVSVSLGLFVTIIGIPLFFLFLGGVRFFALAEGRIIQALVGVQMPKNPHRAPAAVGIRNQLMASLRDTRSWTAMLYFLLSLPVATILFSIIVSLLSTSLALIAVFPFRVGGWLHFYAYHKYVHSTINGWSLPDWTLPGFSIIGIALLLGTFYLIRFFSLLQAGLAKKTLVTRFIPAPSAKNGA